MAAKHDPKAEAELNRRTVLGLATGAVAAATAAPADSKPGSDVTGLDAVALAAAIRGRKVSCVEVMGAYLDRIAAVNPKVNAIVALQDREALLAQARERDDQAGRGEFMGPLHGFPHAVKDLQQVKGVVSTQGSPIFKGFVPKVDSLMVGRIRDAGAIFVGKTNTPEFGFGSHTFNPVYGATRNAYDQARSAGGSSGGAAVSLALRMAPVADGSDYGGSLRNPAGWNGVFGFRTSSGRVPVEGKDVWLPSMGVQGPMARNVADLALLLSVQAGYDPKAPMSLEGDGAVFRGRLQRDFKGARIGWLGDFGGATPYEPGVLETCRGALKAFEDMGCVVEEARPDYPVDAVWRAAMLLRGWQQGGGVLAYYQDPARRALMKPEAVWEVETGMKASAYDVTAASAVRTEWYNAVRKLFARHDFLVMPTAQVFPFPVEERWPKAIAGQAMATYHEWMKATLLITMTGCPALAAPAGFGPNGLPIGIQIVGPNHAEMACLQIGRAYEQAANVAAMRKPALA